MDPGDSVACIVSSPGQSVGDDGTRSRLSKLIASLVKSLAAIEDVDGTNPNPSVLEQYIGVALGIADRSIIANKKPILNQRKLHRAMESLVDSVDQEISERASIQHELLDDLALLNSM